MWFIIAGETDQRPRSLVFLWTYGEACAEVPAVHFVPAGWLLADILYLTLIITFVVKPIQRLSHF
jgi:hypothetical protein